MFDLFNRRKLRELEQEIALLNKMNAELIDLNTKLNIELAKAGNRMGELVEALREVDQGLWNFSQSMSLDQARKAILPALSSMESRKVAESKRIESMLLPELQKVYGR